MAKQLSLHSFLIKNNALTSKRLDSEKHVIKDVLREISLQVEKNVAAKKRKNPNNNINDLVMTTEKISTWKKEFTFWDTQDGEVD